MTVPTQVEAVLAQADQLLAQFYALRARHQQVSLYCTVLYYCVVLYCTILCTLYRSASRQSSTAPSPS